MTQVIPAETSLGEGVENVVRRAESSDKVRGREGDCRGVEETTVHD